MKLTNLIVREKKPSQPSMFYAGTTIIKKRHLSRIQAIKSMRSYYPPRSNILTRVLSRLDKKSNIYDLYDAFQAFRFPLNDVNGRVLYNVFHRAPVKEVILVDTIDNTGDIIEVIHYPFYGTVPPVPNGREFDYPDNSIAIYRINGYELLKQYKLYLNSIPPNETHNNRQFMYEKLVLPLLSKLLDVSILNTYLHSVDDSIAMKCVPKPTSSYDSEYTYIERLVVHTKYMSLKSKGNDGLEAVFDAFDLPLSSGYNTATFINSKVNPHHAWVNMFILSKYARFFGKLDTITRVPWLKHDVTLLALKGRIYSESSANARYIPSDIRKEIVSQIHNIPTTK